MNLEEEELNIELKRLRSMAEVLEHLLTLEAPELQAKESLTGNAGIYKAVFDLMIPAASRRDKQELMKELERNIGYPAPTYRIPAVIARAAGVLASVYYRLIRRKPVFTAYSIDVLRSNSLVSSARAREELGFTSRSWQESIRDHVEWFRAEGMLPNRR